MSYILTSANVIYTFDPLPEDQFVLIYVRGHQRTFIQSIRPIAQYRAAVDWAVDIADHLRRAVIVLPVTWPEYMKMKGSEAKAVQENPHDWRHLELLQEWVVKLLEKLRTIKDIEESAEAKEILLDMGVAR